jgi:hypothetical protein
MTQYIPKLARFGSGKSAPKRRPAITDGSRASLATVNVEHIARLVPRVRQRLAIGRPFSDAALLASLIAIARHPSHEERWRAAEASTLGQYLASSGKDRRQALVTLLSLLPRLTL